MEDKGVKGNNMDLPPYTVFQDARPQQSRKSWIVGGLIAVLLIIILIVATLFGVYMTQKHTEQMVTMSLTSANGQNVQQTISVNDREDVALFYVITDTSSVTTLFDYKLKIIGIRMSNSSTCFLLRMDEVTTPSIPEILKTIAYVQSQDTPTNSGDTITYVVTPLSQANPRDVGINVNILCSDVAIYWSKMVRAQDRKKAQDVVVVVVVVVK